MYGALVTYAYAIVAGMLTAAVLAAWPWARSRRRFAVAGVATLLSWIAWHLLLNATGAFGHGAPGDRRARGRRRGDRRVGRDDTGRLRLVRP